MFLRDVAATALIALTVTACASQPSKKVDWHDNDSYSGWVTDAATGEPIEGVVVVVAWRILRRHHMLIVEGNPDEEVIRLEETLTNKDGYFAFKPLGYYTPPLGWQRDETLFPLLNFFKPGYEPRGQTRVTWEFGDDIDRNVSKTTGRALKKRGWQREVPLFRYLTSPVPEWLAVNPIHKRMTNEQKILERLTSFASGLSENVELYARSNRQRRKAVEAQWRAIVIVDQEIRKYRPKYEWLSNEIRDALRETQNKR
jgi:hypothetical protein